MPTYRLTQAASDDLVGIYLHGLAEFGQTQADTYHEGLTATFAFLAEYPRAARVRDEITPPVRAHPHRSHLIVYELDAENNVLILRVRHGREDWVSGGDE